VQTNFSPTSRQNIGKSRSKPVTTTLSITTCRQVSAPLFTFFPYQILILLRIRSRYLKSACFSRCDKIASKIKVLLSHSIIPSAILTKWFFFVKKKVRLTEKGAACHLKFKSGHFLVDLNSKSVRLVFSGFILVFEKSVVGFVGMWVPRSGIQVIVGSVAKS